VAWPQDLELEEFRALEREILGDNSHSHHQKPNQQQQQQQQEQPQPQQWSEQPEAALLYPQGQAQEQDWQDQLMQQPQQHPDQQRHQPVMPGAQGGYAAQAAAGAPGLSQSINLFDIRFQDDTEWVDTEFSFADLSLGAQQDQSRPAAQHRLQQQQQQQQQASMQPLGQHPEQPSSDADGPEGPLSQQPYVRSIFRQQQQQQQSRPHSSSSRLGTPAARRGAGPIKSPPGTAAGGRAAVGAAAADADAEQQMLVVPAAAVERWQQLEAAHPNMQQEKVALKKMRQDLETAAQRLEQQRAAWERDRVRPWTSRGGLLCLDALPEASCCYRSLPPLSSFNPPLSML